MKKVAVVVFLVVAAVLGFAAGRLSVSAPPAVDLPEPTLKEVPAGPERESEAEDSEQAAALSAAEAELRQRIDSLLARIDELEARVAELETEHGPEGLNIVR